MRATSELDWDISMCKLVETTLDYKETDQVNIQDWDPHKQQWLYLLYLLGTLGLNILSGIRI